MPLNLIGTETPHRKEYKIQTSFDEISFAINPMRDREIYAFNMQCLKCGVIYCYDIEGAHYAELFYREISKKEPISSEKQ